MSPPVHDSILNFWEMWHTGNPPVGKNLIGDQGTLYFEVNEDFNLNLKLDAAALPNSLRDEVWRRLTGVEWLQGIDGRCRQYRQSAFVLFEWDFGFLRSLQDYSTAAQNLSSILESATKALA